MKEANETRYWLERLFESNALRQKEFESMRNDNMEIIYILTSIIKTMKKKQSEVEKNNKSEKIEFVLIDDCKEQL